MSHSSRTQLLRDRRGIALPLALLGLVAVSLLVTTALVTSSTEVALSSAHQQGARNLYLAETALEGFVGERSIFTPAESRLAAGSYSFTPAGGGAYTVSVSELSRSGLTQLADGTMQRTDRWALVTEPANRRGRSVGALLEVLRELPPFTLNVQAGITVGGNLNVSGNSTISDSTGMACDSAQAQYAIQVSDSASVSVGGSAKVTGTVDTASYNRAQMVELLLGGRSLREAAKYASVRFAAGEFSGRANSYTSSGPRPRTDKYNWGCPVGMGIDCSLAGDNINYLPSVSIDAGGGTVGIQGDHGQGVLIIYNGSAKIEGNFVYKGIVLVEQNLDMRGTGSSSAKIEGTVLVLGENTSIYDEDNVTGNAMITYNACAVADAKSAFQITGVDRAPQKFNRSTFSWFEVVR